MGFKTWPPARTTTELRPVIGMNIGYGLVKSQYWECESTGLSARGNCEHQPPMDAISMATLPGLGGADCPALPCQAVAAQGIVTAPHPSFEWYVNDCATVPPEEVQTDFYLPIQE